MAVSRTYHDERQTMRIAGTRRDLWFDPPIVGGRGAVDLRVAERLCAAVGGPVSVQVWAYVDETGAETVRLDVAGARAAFKLVLGADAVARDGFWPTLLAAVERTT